MDQAKIRLSPEEMDLVTNADWILTKNGIMQKAWHMLAMLQQGQLDMLQHLNQELPGEWRSIPPKISKGENYRGLPYLVLDYPRVFGKADTLAIRTFFWWGNFFSVTLHLAGKYKSLYQDALIRAYPILKEMNYSLGVHGTEWEHHAGPDNYQPLDLLGEDEFASLVREKPFLKLAYMIPLSQWEQAPALLASHYQVMISSLKS